MKFSVPLNLNSQYEIQGLFSLTTSEGPVVFLFSNPLKLESFITTASVMAAAQGGKVGFYDLEAPSRNVAVQQLLQMDPTMAGQVTFLGDDDSLFDVFLKQMKTMVGDTE